MQTDNNRRETKNEEEKKESERSCRFGSKGGRLKKTDPSHYFIKKKSREAGMQVLREESGGGQVGEETISENGGTG